MLQGYVGVFLDSSNYQGNPKPSFLGVISYNPYIGVWKPSFFHGFLGSRWGMFNRGCIDTSTQMVVVSCFFHCNVSFRGSIEECFCFPSESFETSKEDDVYPLSASLPFFKMCVFFECSKTILLARRKEIRNCRMDYILFYSDLQGPDGVDWWWTTTHSFGDSKKQLFKIIFGFFLQTNQHFMEYRYQVLKIVPKET